MPKFTSKMYAQALFEATSETNPKDLDIVLDRFVKILTQNGDLNKFEEIEKEFTILQGKGNGVQEVEVTVAKEMEVNANLISSLNKVIGNKVDIKKKIDANIIGGVVVRVDETLIDASIKTQLNNLNTVLKQ